MGMKGIVARRPVSPLLLAEASATRPGFDHARGPAATDRGGAVAQQVLQSLGIRSACRRSLVPGLRPDHELTPGACPRRPDLLALIGTALSQGSESS